MIVPIANASDREGLLFQVSENNPQVWDTVLNIALNAPNKHRMSNISGDT